MLITCPTFLILNVKHLWKSEISIKTNIPLNPKKEEFEYVYVEKDGTVRELDNEEIEYLQTDFKLGDGARPYIKSNYEQLAPDKKISGFLQRTVHSLYKTKNIID